MSPDPVKKPFVFKIPGTEPQPYWNRRTILFWLFVIVAIVAIVWMVMGAWSNKKLVCDPSFPPSLIGFGGCKEE